MKSIRLHLSVRISGPYLADADEYTWTKIRNPRYSEIVGRGELFRRRTSRGLDQRATDGWAGYMLALAEAQL